LLRDIGRVALLGLVAAVMLLLFFAWLAEEVFNKEFTSFDDNFELWVHSFANPVLTAIFTFFTTIGSIAGVLVMAALTFGLLVWRRHLRSAWLLALAVVGGVLLNQVLKFFFERPRPELWPVTLPRPTTFSFPSGHATASLCYFGVLVWFGLKFLKQPALKVGWTILMIFSILMVGLSRIYFGVHYPTDVLAGYLSGGFWMAVLLSGESVYNRWYTRSHKPRNEIT
jgi:undecaprenyl-diphosphatase